MKTKKITIIMIAVLWAAAAAFPAIGFAEAIQGEIASLNLDASMLSVTKADGTAKIDIKLPTNVTYKGISALEELTVGQQVVVDAQKNDSTGMYEAKEIKKA